VIYRKYYGTKMMLFILGAFYATMVAAGYLTELIFGGLGLVPAGRHAKVLQASVQWNYTTVLNIIFLIIAAALCYRFARTGGIPMLKMMGGAPEPPGAAGGHAHHDMTGMGAGNPAGRGADSEGPAMPLDSYARGRRRSRLSRCEDQL